MPASKPKVGVSQCLLGDAVRYDGNSKPDIIVLERLSKIFELIPVCPEVEAGLSIPRPPVQLSASIDNPQLTGRDNPAINITAALQSYCSIKIPELRHLHGFVFKSRSPSCGLNSTPIVIDNKCVTETGRGIFARALCNSYPDLAVIEECALARRYLLNSFIQAVLRVSTRG